MPSRPRGRLSTPGRKRSWMPVFRWPEDAFGKFAEWVARFMGTPGFIFWMTVFVIMWISFNVFGIFAMRWDPYPFILLNLFFSTQASYSTPLIMLAQNRQEARDRVSLEHDRAVSAQARADMDFLAREIAALRRSISDVATRDFVRSELRELLEELEESREIRAELLRQRQGEEPPR